MITQKISVKSLVSSVKSSEHPPIGVQSGHRPPGRCLKSIFLGEADKVDVVYSYISLLFFAHENFLSAPTMGPKRKIAEISEKASPATGDVVIEACKS